MVTSETEVNQDSRYKFRYHISEELREQERIVTSNLAYEIDTTDQKLANSSYKAGPTTMHPPGNSNSTNVESNASSV